MEIKNNSIIIADNEYSSVLFKWKNSYPGLDIKIINKNSVLDKLSFQLKKDPVPYLLKKGYDYSDARKYLNLLRVADYKKNQKLNNLFENLNENGFFAFDEYGKYEFDNRDIYLFEMNEDVELHSLFKRNNYKVEDLDFDDLSLNKTFGKEKHPELLLFPNKFAQYLYVFSDLRKRILENPETKNSYRILVKDNSDIFYVSFFSDIFKLPVCTIITSPLSSNKDVKTKINEILNKRSFAFNDEELKNRYVLALKNIVVKYELEQLNFDFAFANLLEITSSLNTDDVSNDKGISITNRFYFTNNLINYVTCFEYGVFFKEYDDKNVLTDKELVLIDANPSYVKTDLDKRKKLNYLNFNNILMLSRVQQHLSDKIYDSQFMEEYGLKFSLVDISKCGGVYTSDCTSLFLANKFDKQFVKETVGDYKSYDHSYKNIHASIVKENKVWSVTNLEGYINCPFKYYISNVLPPMEDDYFNRAFGNLAHTLFEKIYHKDYDFEAEFARAKESYKKMYLQNKAEYGADEEAYADIAYFWLKQIVPLLETIKEKAAVVPNENDAEVDIGFTITDNDRDYKFYGRIDKILWTKGADGKNYYTIIDYKSGVEKVDPYVVFLGKSTQLPLYYYAIEQNDDEKYDNGGVFGGFGIQHVAFNSIKGTFADDKAISVKGLFKNAIIGGLFSKEENYLTSLGNVKGNDYFYFKDEFKFTEPDAAESILKPKDLVTRYNLNDLIEDAKKATLNTIKKIQNSEFDIMPASSDLKDKTLRRIACDSCGYKDICYHNKAKDVHNYAEDIEDYFLNK